MKRREFHRAVLLGLAGSIVGLARPRQPPRACAEHPGRQPQTELAARFGRGLLLGGYLNPASLALHAALRVTLASAAMMPGGVAMYGFDTEG